jgi:hypothetical protein
MNFRTVLRLSCAGSARTLARPKRAAVPGIEDRERGDRLTTFVFQPCQPRRLEAAEPTSFRIDRLWSRDGDWSIELSHLMDRTYDYASTREPRWHLAARFAHPPAALTLRRV